jgi:hypothetical protein
MKLCNTDLEVYAKEFDILHTQLNTWKLTHNNGN